MKRRTLLKTASGLLLATSPLASLAARRSTRIVIVTYRGPTQVEAGFESILKRSGLKPQFIHFDMNRNIANAAGILDQINQINPDLVLTWGTSVTRAIAGTLEKPNPNRPQCPIVFALVTDPVGANIVKTLKGPNTNDITGVYHVASVEQQLRAMGQYRSFKKIGMLYTPTEANSRLVLKHMQEALSIQDKKLIALKLEKGPATAEISAHIDAQLNQLKDEGADWLYLPPDSNLGTMAKDVVLPKATELGLPSFATTEQLMNSGSLLGLVCSYFEVGQFAGFKAQAILEGKAKAGNIPVETLKTFSLRVNSSVAQTMHMPPPLNVVGIAMFQHN